MKWNEKMNLKSEKERIEKWWRNIFVPILLWRCNQGKVFVISNKNTLKHHFLWPKFCKELVPKVLVTFYRRLMRLQILEPEYGWSISRIFFQTNSGNEVWTLTLESGMKEVRRKERRCDGRQGNGRTGEKRALMVVDRPIRRETKYSPSLPSFLPLFLSFVLFLSPAGQSWLTNRSILSYSHAFFFIFFLLILFFLQKISFPVILLLIAPFLIIKTKKSAIERNDERK